jgi:hypothetical protein
MRAAFIASSLFAVERGRIKICQFVSLCVRMEQLETRGKRTLMKFLMQFIETF